MITKNRYIRVAEYLAVALLCLIHPLSGHTAEARGTVRLDGRELFEFTGENQQLVAERVKRTERRLNLILERPKEIRRAEILKATPESEDLTISVSGARVTIVNQEDAEDNLTTVEDLAKVWAAQIDTALVDAKARRTTSGARFFTEVRSSIETAFKRILEASLRIIPNALAAIIVLSIFWIIAAGVRWGMRFIFRLIVEDLTLENLIKQIAYYSVWVLGLIIAADALGFETETVITGLGLTSLALGFALKDIISNFVSGLVILLFRPFRLGDQIVVGPTEGSVVRIDLRATQIRTYDGRLVLVPNQELLTSTVTNNTASPVRRAKVTIYLGYDTDIPAVLRLMQKSLAAEDGVLPDPSPAIRVEDLGKSDLELSALFWADSRRSDFVATSARVRERLVSVLQASGFSLPDPALRVVRSA